MKPKDDLDKMLADTLSGVRPQKRKETVPSTSEPTAPGAPPAPGTKPAGGTESRPRAQPAAGQASLDKLLSDTMSGLERGRRPQTQSGTSLPPRKPAPAGPSITPAQPPPAQASAPQSTTEKLQAFLPEKVTMSAPVFPKVVPAPAPVEDEEPVDGTKFGQYVLLERIANGGMAEVWKARMRGVEGFQKIVAIKKILPHLSDNQDFIEMFVDEAKLAAQLNHNNIIHIYDLGKIQSSYYIAMEYVDGHDLKTILRRGEEHNQPMQVELALFITSKVAAALDYAHRKHDFEGKDLGLVHRDVSPQNVLVSQDGDIKLCDFGIAKAASKASHTQAGALKGKLQYMSPEQAWGRNVDRRSDIFALATVLFEMLTGRKLFTGDNEISILEQVREARVTAPSALNDEVTPEVDAIVLKALQIDPAARFQTAGEMAKDIDAVLYNFRPTPTSADLAIYMHRIWSAELPPPMVHHEVQPEPEPPRRSPFELKAAAPVAAAAAVVIPPRMIPPPVSAPPAAAAVPRWDDAPTLHEVPKKSLPMIPLAIAVVVLAGLGGYFALRPRAAGPAAAAARPAPIAPPPGSATTETFTTSSAATATSSTAAEALTATTATQTPTLDQTRINEEVQRRLAAERTKLEQTRAQQQLAQTAATAAVSRPAPPPTATQAAVPAPQVPQPATVTQAPPPAVAEARPAVPAPAEETPARAQTGDLVPQGTAGLTPARIQRQVPAAYPPVAKMQKVQGSVILSVLISETGQVLETRVLSGVARAVGINEAAVESIRRSAFTPGMKDGARVKSWTTVRVDFRL